MKELLRLRLYARGLKGIAAAALLFVVLAALLKAAAIWQSNTVFASAFGESPGAEEEAKSPLSKLERLAPGLSARVQRAAAPLADRWNGFFGIDPESTAPDNQRRRLYGACAGLFLVGMGAGFADMFAIYFTLSVGQRLLFNLRRDLFGHLQTLSLSFFEDQRSGDLISRMSNDTNVLQVLFSASMATLLEAPITSGALVVVMLVLNWRLALATFALLPLVSFMAAWLGGKIKRYARAVQARTADVAAFVEQALAGTRVIQAFGMEPHVKRLFEGPNRGVLRTAMRAARVQAANAPVAGLLLATGVVLALFIGGNEIIAGRMTASHLVVFIFAMQVLGNSVSRFTRLNLTVQQAAGACGRIWEILDTRPTLTDAPDAVDLAAVEGRLEFRDVSFAYHEGRPVLTGVNVRIPAGQVVAVAGPSGAGKTTLANLIPRLYDVTGGAVLIDGTDVRKVTRASLRRFMSIVPQETVLFGTSVRENIAYGRPEATLEEVVAAAEAAQAHAFISALPQDYDTPIGERGAKLSGGQRQRLAIARALLRDPRILILDEATSSLDAESESAVQEALTRLLRGRTAVIIAHRLSTIRDADRILVMESGRVVEDGSHAQLMAAGGLYRALYETQLREEKAADADAVAAEKA